jgi:hypothetical protein
MVKALFLVEAETRLRRAVEMVSLVHRVQEVVVVHRLEMVRPVEILQAAAVVAL